MLIRQLRDSSADAEAVQTVTRRAFSALHGPPPAGYDPRGSVMRLARTRHLATTDPGGCWIAEQDGEPVGIALSLKREGVWMLSLFAVVPEAQGEGVGRLLLERAAGHGRGCLRGMLCASASPAAARRYRQAGFTLHPAMKLAGHVDRSRLLDPGDIPVHPGGPAHVHLLDSVDRRIRGAAHGPDHTFMRAHFEELLVADTLAGSGYCYRDGGVIRLLAATSKRIAARLLREALARVPDGTEAQLEFLTADQEWAVDVGLELGLTLTTTGYLAVRGMKPPAPYVPSSAFV
ncbi:GNAT family N-acetyltransferase [Kitasatospora sp. NPDC002227]|uniref:GNAT family N-acetyltransferase n=1 Tax=Kitasatospora sp. NPDC002227 TaxID=3154773 RepID=UPI0033234525